MDLHTHTHIKGSPHWVSQRWDGGVNPALRDGLALLSSSTSLHTTSAMTCAQRLWSAGKNSATPTPDERNCDNAKKKGAKSQQAAEVVNRPSLTDRILLLTDLANNSSKMKSRSGTELEKSSPRRAAKSYIGFGAG